jgi:hypothetical protein
LLPLAGRWISSIAMKPTTRWSPVLLVDPRLARHPTLIGERMAGTYRIISPPRPRRPPASAGAWLMICAASACAVVITAGLLG